MKIFLYLSFLNNTPLHYACKKTSYETIQLLLGNKADANLRNQKIVNFNLNGIQKFKF